MASSARPVTIADGRSASLAADIMDGGLSASAQRPSFSILMGTGSYRLRSRCAKTAAADASDTSCSLDRPPYSTPTRRRFTISEYRSQEPEYRRQREAAALGGPDRVADRSG